MASQTPIPAGNPVLSTAVAGPSTGPFSISFPFFSIDDVVVQLVNSSGVATTLVRGTDYSLTATINDDGIYPSGSITLVNSITNQTVTRYRKTPVQRTSQFPLTGYFDRVALNAEFSRIACYMQENAMNAVGTISFPASDGAAFSGTLPPAGNRAKGVMAFDATGLPYVVPSSVGAYLAFGSDGLLKSMTLATTAVSITAWLTSNLLTVATSAAQVRSIIGAPSTAANTYTGAQTLPADPVNPLDAATKQYVDNKSLVAQLPPNRNRIINGDFQVDQRNAGAAQTVPADGSIHYILDRWYVSCTGAAVTIQQVAGSASGSKYGLQITGATGNTGVVIGQRIESLQTQDMYAAQPVIFSAWLKSSSISSANFGIYYPGSTDNWGSKTAEGVGGVGVSASMVQRSAGIASLGNAFLLRGATVEISFGALTNGQTFVVEQAQFEVNATVTAFERRMPGETLLECRRYFEAIPYNSGKLKWFGFAPSAGSPGPLLVPFSVPKRVIPSVDISGVTWALTNLSAGSPTVDSSGTEGALLSLATQGQNLNWTLNATAGQMNVSAEL